ncbi:hypothetical protein TPA0909_68040 [Streptomyces albus]|nr:hypothetical protein TPA0909_68040 [Streptomyces albus]
MPAPAAAIRAAVVGCSTRTAARGTNPARPQTRSRNPPVDPRFHPAAHPTPVGEFGQRHRLVAARAGAQRIVGRDDQHDLLLADLPGGSGPVAQLVADGHIGDAARHPLAQLLLGDVLAQPQRHLRVEAPHPRDRLGEDADRQTVHRGDLQLAAADPGGCPRRAAGLPGAAHGQFGVRQEGAAHGGEPHTARQPLQQRAADLPLQRLDLVGERRLRHVQRLGGAGEGRLLDHRDEVFHLPQTHRPPPPAPCPYRFPCTLSHEFRPHERRLTSAVP